MRATCDAVLHAFQPSGSFSCVRRQSLAEASKSTLTLDAKDEAIRWPEVLEVDACRGSLTT